MSDWYEALIDKEATEDTSVQLAQTAIDVLSRHDIIVPEANADCVLGGTGYPPGSAIPNLYELTDREGQFWEMRTNGLEVTTDRWFNMFGTTVLDWIACPRCKAKCNLERDFEDRFCEQIGNWLEAKPTSSVTCDSCGEASRIYDWESKPHLGFCMLSFQFWNWPPLDSSSWKIDIGSLISEALGHRLIRTWGRI